MFVEDVDDVTGPPLAVVLPQQRSAGTHPRGAPMLHADALPTNTADGACPACHGLGRVYTTTARLLVPDLTLGIRERTIPARPPEWHGLNLRDICVTLGFDIDAPWKSLSRKDRNWLRFTDELPAVPVYAGFESDDVKRAMRYNDEPGCTGAFTSAKRYVLHTFASSNTPRLRRACGRRAPRAASPVSCAPSSDAIRSDNGAYERVHRELNANVIKSAAANAKLQQCVFNTFVHTYNYARPHEALLDETPAPFAYTTVNHASARCCTTK